MTYELFKYLQTTFPSYAVFLDYTDLIHIAHSFEHHPEFNKSDPPSIFRIMYRGPYEGRHGLPDYSGDYLVMEDDLKGTLKLGVIVFYDYSNPSFLDDLAKDIGTPSKQVPNRSSHLRKMLV